MRDAEFREEWLWEVWSDDGPALGTGSIVAAQKMAYRLIENGETNVHIKSGDRIIPITERRSSTPGAADPGGELPRLRSLYEPSVVSCEGMTPDLEQI